MLDVAMLFAIGGYVFRDCVIPGRSFGAFDPSAALSAAVRSNRVVSIWHEGGSAAHDARPFPRRAWDRRPHALGLAVASGPAIRRWGRCNPSCDL